MNSCAFRRLSVMFPSSLRRRVAGGRKILLIEPHGRMAQAWQLICLRNARAFPLLPAALASVPFGFVLSRVRVQCQSTAYTPSSNQLTFVCGDSKGISICLVSQSFESGPPGPAL
jgi:hypothetical protein